MLALLAASEAQLSQDSWVWLCMSLAAGDLGTLAQHRCSAQHSRRQQRHLRWHHFKYLPGKPQLYWFGKAWFWVAGEAQRWLL